MAEKVAVIGLGYVGLPVAVALAGAFPGTVGFDISKRRVATLQAGEDWTGEIESQTLKQCGIRITDKAEDLAGASIFIVTVPTPIDRERRPDLSPLDGACRFVGPALSKGGIVVFESTVYPGVTEDFCGPLLEKYSGLKRGRDFTLGYSPERINPGDKQHRLETITKIISAEDDATLQRLRSVYGAIIKAGLHEAPSIKVAEAAKVLENTQRDINIALMNELSIILDRMNVRTKDVLEAAGTKWNFLRFSPGLVGGHCIGVDPYYLTHKAQEVGYHPEVILAGRRINDGMGTHAADQTARLMMKKGLPVVGSRILVMGAAFKENCPDLRNSKVVDIVRRLVEYNANVEIWDPWVSPVECLHEFGLASTVDRPSGPYDGVIVAVAHREFRDLGIAGVRELAGATSVVYDIKGIFPRNETDGRF